MPAKITQPSKDVKNPYGYTEMDWAAQLDPAYAAARAEVRRLSVGADGTLSVKVKEFVVMGVLASRGLQYGVAAHMRRALEYGATKEELFETIKAAAVPGGGVAYSVGVRALQELDQEGAFPRPSPSSPSRRQRGKASPPPPAGRRRGKAATRCAEAFPLLREVAAGSESYMPLPAMDASSTAGIYKPVWSSIGCSTL